MRRHPCNVPHASLLPRFTGHLNNTWSEGMILLGRRERILTTRRGEFLRALQAVTALMTPGRCPSGAKLGLSEFRFRV
jgi:hypothetical protein